MPSDAERRFCIAISARGDFREVAEFCSPTGNLVPPHPSLPHRLFSRARRQMGCCGEPRSKDQPPPPPQGNNAGQGAIYPPTYPTNTQPSPHPPLQYPDPSKTPHPPNGYVNGNGTMHGQMPSTHQMQTLNGHPGVGPTGSPTHDFNPTGYPPGPQATMGHQGPPQNNFGPMLDPTIQRPTPIHPPQRSTTVSPPLAMGTPGPFTGPGSVTSSTPSGAGGSTFDDGKLSISVE